MAYKTSKEIRSAIGRRFYQKHKEKVLAKAKGYNAARQVRDKERLNKQSAEYYKQNKEIILSRMKTDYATNTYKYKDTTLKWMYGITLEQYNEMLIKQEYCCAICKRHQSSFKKVLAVDHCHKTGKVRGLLCTNCNMALGGFRDNIDCLKEAISYLQPTKNS